MRRAAIRRFLDSRAVWSTLAWLALAGVVVWLFVLNRGLDDNTQEIKRVTAANSDAIAFLCDTNAILEAIVNLQVTLLRADQLEHPAQQREQAIQVLRGYAQVLRDKQPCVSVEKVNR